MSGPEIRVRVLCGTRHKVVTHPLTPSLASCIPAVWFITFLDCVEIPVKERERERGRDRVSKQNGPVINDVHIEGKKGISLNTDMVRKVERVSLLETEAQCGQGEGVNTSGRHLWRASDQTTRTRWVDSGNSLAKRIKCFTMNWCECFAT